MPRRSGTPQHLRVLKDCGLVDFETHGTRNLYRLQPEGVDALRRWLDDFWGTALAGFEKHARKQARKGKKR